MPACDPGLPEVRIGASVGANGEVVVHYAPCPDESIQSVELLRPRGNVIGDDDPVLWRIVRRSSSAQRDFTVGTTTDGFAEAVPFSGPLPSGPLAAVVDTNQVPGTSVEFEASLLQQERILSDDRFLELAAFEDRARETCR
jgi:hypothetical protein